MLDMIVINSRKILIILIILLVQCPTFSQIVKLHKNDPFPYDTGAGIDITTYRYIRAKTVDCDNLISINTKIEAMQDSLNNYLKNQIQLEEQKNVSYEKELKQKNLTISKMDSISVVQQKEMDRMEYKKSFLKRKTTYYAFVIGLFIPLLLR